jgi:hypothetical protein
MSKRHPTIGGPEKLTRPNPPRAEIKRREVLIPLTDNEIKFTQHDFENFMASTSPALTWDEWVQLAHRIIAADEKRKAEK